MALNAYPANDLDGTISVLSTNQTKTAFVANPLTHDNPNFEQGYAVLVVDLTIAAGDSFSFQLGFNFEGAVNNQKDITLEDGNGNTTFTTSQIIMFGLHRQREWNVNEGLLPKYTKTGTNGTATIKWRMLWL